MINEMHLNHAPFLPVPLSYGIEFDVKAPKATSRSAGIKLGSSPEDLAQVKPLLPEDYVPTGVDKLCFKFVTTGKEPAPGKFPVTITAGFEAEQHEFKFTGE